MHSTLLTSIALVVLGMVNAMAVEEATYTVVERDGRFEIRDYDPQVLAETLVDGTLEEAGNRAFRTLFRYISGANQSSSQLAMTAPVSQESKSVKIAMTAPVSQMVTGAQWAVSFMMPSGQALDSLPTPTDPAVTLRQVPARRMAAIRYAGTWSEGGYNRHLMALREWIHAKGLIVDGEPVWARYNPPFTPWFWRRNEILIPVGRTD